MIADDSPYPCTLVSALISDSHTFFFFFVCFSVRYSQLIEFIIQKEKEIEKGRPFLGWDRE